MDVNKREYFDDLFYDFIAVLCLRTFPGLYLFIPMLPS